MQECKVVKVPIHVGVRISAEKCPKAHKEEEDMFHVPYASVVARLMYAMVGTIPNIAYVVAFLKRYMSKLIKENWTNVKRVFSYFQGTTNHAMCYQGRAGPDMVLDVHGFLDANLVGDLDRRRSTSGYVFNLFGGAMSWMGKKQVIVALSAIEVEYMATMHACKESLWLHRL